jgi:hypothetical protein
MSPEVRDSEELDDALGDLRIRDETHSSISKGSDEGKPAVSASETSSRKPPSLDGKSTTSGTTFALDEKESLRPDDSASVMAAEEEDAFSVHGSVAASSRLGSESGAKAFRAQFHEISERMGYPVVPATTGARAQAVTQPTAIVQGASSAQAKTVSDPTVPPATDTVPNGGIPYGFTSSSPDEKLLEALDTPKDRLFLLRLEQDVIEFVKDSKYVFLTSQMGRERLLMRHPQRTYAGPAAVQLVLPTPHTQASRLLFLDPLRGHRRQLRSNLSNAVL